MFRVNRRQAVLGGMVGILILGLWLLWPSSVPDFRNFSAGSERKTVFFNYLRPLIDAENTHILALRHTLMRWQKNPQNIGWWQTRRLQTVTRDYRLPDFDADKADDWQRLLQRVDVIPPSLALAQAANESAWGTSRFARRGHNYFGQWCFTTGCGVVPNQRTLGKDHEVEVFASPAESVASYLLNLNAHPAYQRLREIRQQRRQRQQPVSGLALAAGLEKYSERGVAYIQELREMIRYNRLEAYDQVYSSTSAVSGGV
jgi:Bax protein